MEMQLIQCLGCILSAVLNAPGSWHDSRIARPIYTQLTDSTATGYFLVANTAFPCGTAQVQKKIQTPLKSGDALPRALLAHTERMALDRQLLSYHQTAEWGMRALQGGFGRLHVPLSVYAEARFWLLCVITRAFNLRVRMVGINQIRTIYCDIWKAADGDAIWEGFVSMLMGDIVQNDRVARFHIQASEE
jgi:DDE superfamily endonuclease